MEAAIEGAACVGFDGRIQTANAAYLAMHGVDASEMIGSSANLWVHADYRSDLVKAAVELGHAEKIERNIVGLRGDGSAFPQFIAMVRVPDGEAGAHYRFARDVTRQNELSEQLNQAMKMEAIGRLAGGIAHDFNNLLMAILTAGDHLQEYFRGMAGAEEESEMADMIAMAGARAAALTTQLLDFAHVRPPMTVTIDVNQSVRNMLELVAPGLGKSIEVEADLSEESLLSPGDPSRFDSGLLNVALNAKDAMPEGGRLIVKTSAVTIDPKDPAFAGFQPRGEKQLRIDMTDTGSGMDAETVAKVFDPFFTTKPAGKGTGLGLSVFSAYVREVGGALKIASSPGEGTTCSIYVPLSSDNSEANDLLIATSDTQGSETVLLAEDEHIVAQAIQRMLRNCGYKVIHCGDGLEAVDTYRERADDIDLVLLDFRMPVMTGAEAFLELRKLDPHVPVVLMSGNLSMSEFSALEEKGLNAILSKPCSREELTQAIRKGLRDPPKKP
jgi:PAS domain S-box-containing protein